MKEPDYFLIYKESKKPSLYLTSIKPKTGKGHVLISLHGNPAKVGYRELIAVLGRTGGLEPYQSNSSDSVYALRPDLVSLVGSYMLLLKRSRKPERWAKVLSQLTYGSLKLFGQHFSNFFLIALELSMQMRRERSGRTWNGNIIPEVAASVSAGMREILRLVV